MVLPKMKKIGGVDVPKPLTDLRDTVQKEVLDRIINWDVKFVLPMAGESGNPSVSGLVSTTAAAASLCMMLSCAPAVLALMRGGPSKANRVPGRREWCKQHGKHGSLQLRFPRGAET